MKSGNTFKLLPLPILDDELDRFYVTLMTSTFSCRGPQSGMRLNSNLHFIPKRGQITSRLPFNNASCSIMYNRCKSHMSSSETRPFHVTRYSVCVYTIAALLVLFMHHFGEVIDLNLKRFHLPRMLRMM